jgi:hypothetical protein
MLVRILIAIAGVLVLFAAVAATRPSAYHVERKLEVPGSADVVFGVLNDLHQFAGVPVFFGSPLTADPNMQKTFDGPAAGVGQSFAWSGKDAGTGRMTIEENVPGQKVRMKLEFVKPMASTAACTLSLAGTPTGSFVTWSMDGNHNFLGKAFGMFMDMDKMLGADIEKGLVRLKTAAEDKQVAIAAAAAAQAAADRAAAAEAARTAADTPVRGKTSQLLLPLRDRRGWRAVTRADEGEDKKRAKRQVYGAGAQDTRRNPISRVQDRHRHPERELFQHPHEHQRPIALDVACDEQEHELPRERHADESVEVFRLRNRRR